MQFVVVKNRSGHYVLAYCIESDLYEQLASHQARRLGLEDCSPTDDLQLALRQLRTVQRAAPGEPPWLRPDVAKRPRSGS